MPPSYINVGAFVDEGTMVDSHVLVGSCAQIGKRVHLSAGVQIGGVLEPVGQTPVVIEDEAFIGADCIIVEGIRIGRRAVLAPGLVLSRGVSVYDAVNERILDRGAAIPENAVVVPGARPLTSAWAASKGLSVHCPVIIKYRDLKSNASLVLEEALR
jgi:2,3,4,5-tetrahydropyridine-2-carboxylate N-succinyltransferase